MLRKLNEYEDRARALGAERDALRSERDVLRAERDVLRAERDDLAGVKGELATRVARLETEARAFAGERERWFVELAEARAAAQEQEGIAREQAELRVRLGDEYATSVAALTRRLSELEAQLAARPADEGRPGELEAALSAARSALADRETALAAAEARVRELEAGAPASDGDDLTQLRGIGPSYARALRSAGITRFSQIAGWTDDDLARIASLLRTRVERIRRDDWVGGARRVLEGTP